MQNIEKTENPLKSLPHFFPHHLRTFKPDHDCEILRAIKAISGTLTKKTSRTPYIYIYIYIKKNVKIDPLKYVYQGSPL